jgi:putative addiction module killer protein/probable addiction module antidote protein
MYEIRHYLTADEKDVYLDWLRKQRDITARIAVDRRVNRVEQGNFGDHKFCRDGVWELRIDVGAGYRVYYAIAGKEIVLLLCGGDKRTQDADSTALANIGRIGKGGQEMKDRTHDEAMAEMYREDPAYALQLLNSILEDGDQSELLIALRQMAKAFGGVQAIAEQAHLNPTQLYRTLSPEGNPALSSFSAILKAMGMRLSVQPIQHILTHL